MDKITHKVRCEQWTSIIKECLASGMPKTTWCREHGISDKSFFYWQRILREEAYLTTLENTLTPAVKENPAPTTTDFIEIKMTDQASSFEKIFIATGYTDLRRGIDGLASTIKFQFDLDPFQKHILFLFCGKRTDRIKGLVWEGDGFLLLYKRLNIGGFSWPRTKEEAMEITPEQFQMLMQGLSIVAKYPIKELKDPPKTM